MTNTIKFNDNYPDISESLRLFGKSQELIPSQTQTLAKGTSQYVKGIAPIFAKSAIGSKIIDVDGNEYLDFTMAVGPLSLGYSYPAVDEAIKKQLESGITFSLPHYLEIEAAELISEVIPNAEKVRFSKSGADVTSAAIRAARAYTGKSTVLCCGYHGWHDWYIAVTDKNIGIPEVTKELTYTFNYNDIESLLAAIDSDTAAVILEPVTFDEPQNEFLHKLREICTEKGIVLIFDEMWTGFRMALGGAQEYFGINADLAVFSKAVANGMPVSIISGKSEIMNLFENDVFFYTTFGGEALSLAAVIATINEIKDKNVISYLNEKGQLLKDGYNEIAKKLSMDYTFAKGYNFRSMMVFNHPDHNGLLLKSILQQELIKCGILWGGFHNMSFSHSQIDIDYTLQAYKHCLGLLKEAVDSGNPESYLKGEMLKPVFRKVGNFNTKPRNF
ncbi:MAG: aminotransferase class III-fold pyridoxal phosphate-dependent enzyme [Candidatus Kapabacteria bacterium]|nr:aminotransferase class III-fold pyridoxal phosphate-dependent enzyme [Ignavibacteriota bacterium]MCW5884749.1 aminotransferase class III-fold pyridoxal phosphate-dependent enzyme [Candidatus Kapabacteria bacterium]